MYKLVVGSWNIEDGRLQLATSYILNSKFYRLISLGIKCVQAVSAAWDKSVIKRTQVVPSFAKVITNTGSIHSFLQMAGKFRLVLSPVFPQPNTYISQMERAVYTQYPQHLLLRLLFNIIRERA